jgi:peptide chain release factor 2
MLEKRLSTYQGGVRDFDDANTLLAMGEEENDETTWTEGQTALLGLEKELARLELEVLLSGDADGNSCYLSVNAGAGGTEAQDWTEMILRMYTRYAERRGYRCSLMEESAGEEAGLKSATILIEGDYAYGWLKGESGVHRLVRISPFDSGARRHTSFGSVWVSPVVDDTIEVEILDKDLKVDTYRASGAGGQHVNKTDSAIRITHMPTGIVVQCQNDRSQHRNRDQAMQMLKARLYERELKKREDAANAVEAGKTDIGFGHQIRSYVLHPYQMIKDVRTSVETSDTQGVLDGDINKFLEANLMSKV